MAVESLYTQTLALPALRKLLFPPTGLKLDPRGVEYFHRTREDWLGCPLQEYASEEDIKKAWETIDQNIKPFIALLEVEKGPFLCGDTLCYADLFLAAVFTWMQVMGGTDMLERVLSYGQPLQRLWEATKPYR